MKHLDRPLARRSLIKGAGLGLGAGMVGALAGATAQSAAAATPEGGEIWSSEYWAKKGDVPLWMFRKRVGAPKAGEPSRPVLFFVHGSSVTSRVVRSQRARARRIFRHERIRPLWVRLLDHGPRELRQVGAHLRQCRYRQRRRGFEGGGGSRRPRNRPAEVPFPRRILRRACAPAPTRWWRPTAPTAWCWPRSPTRARARRR